MGNLWTTITSCLGLDPDLSYKDYERTMRKVTARQDPDTGAVQIGIGPTKYPPGYTVPIDVTYGFKATSVEVAEPASMFESDYWLAPPKNTDADINWWKPFLYGEALVAGTLILGPTLLDIVAAIAGSGKKTKTHDPKIFADGLRHASETFRDTTSRAMPTIMAGLMSPAISLPFVYLNLEALHKQKLIDSAVAHTIEPIMIGSEMIKAIGKSGIIGQVVDAVVPG
jgi:hypothetical protein